LAVTGAFIAAVMAVTLTYAHVAGLPGFRFMPGQVDTDVTLYLNNAVNNDVLITPTIWILLMLAIPFAMMLLLGVIGHFVRSRIAGNLETFAFVSGLTVSVLTWISLPGVDYVLNVLTTPAVIEGLTIHRLRPIISPPEPGMILYRLAYQFIVNVPIYIFTVLFVLYFFEFRERWKERTGDISGPLLNVRTEDIRQAVVMFLGGLLVSIIGIWLIIMFNAPGFVWANLFGLFADIGNPNGLERVFEFFVRDELQTFFWLFAEHNFVRTLLMMVIGPIFWSAVLWLFAVKYKSRAIAFGSSAAVIVTGIAAVVWTQIDLVSGVFVPASPVDELDPWVLSAHLGFRAAILYGILVGAVLLIAIARVLGKGGTGSWWFPLFVSVFALEYFVYDDQFTLIALVVLPIIIASVYRAVYRSRLEVDDEGFLLTYIRFSLMSVAIAEVLSTAMIVGGVALWETMDAGSVIPALARIVPHAIVEIPAFLMAAAVSFRIAKDLGPSITNRDWESVPSKTRALISDSRTWRTFALIIFFLLLGALIEAYVTDIVYWWIRFGIPPP
ncbi:MAG: stage II sporulation protein M, partial [Candidatus Thorarchaeota archaeon SMTZ1-83]